MKSSYVLRVMLSAVLWGASIPLWAGTYSGGTGEVTNPYKIGNPADWQELMDTPDDWDEHFVLTSHLDLAGMTVTPVGNPTTKFTGVFDGAGYTIYNAVINQPGTDYAGLFGYMDSPSIIRNLSLENLSVSGKNWVGGLAGRNDYGLIENVRVNGTVIANGNYAGGLVGSTVNSTIQHCSTFGSVTATNYVGGMIGFVGVGVTFQSCYSVASVNGVEQAGGLAGWMAGGTIAASYAAGSVNSTTDVGGLIGKYDGGTVNSSFWDTQASGQATSPAGIGKTTAQMKRHATFTSAGWDFVGVWADGQHQTYPYLRMRPAADIDGDGLVRLEDFAILAAQWLTEPPIIVDSPESDITWVYIDDPGVPGHEGFVGFMSKYETTNAQFAQYLNAALASGDIIVQTDNRVYAVGDTSYSEPYFSTFAVSNESQITYSGGRFSVRTRDGHSMADHPVVTVSWYGATAFANFYGWRLPTEWEWQAVADYDGSYIYGCGTTIDQSMANHWELDNGSANPLGLTSEPYTSPVGYYPAYGYGMADLAGNVWEWTNSIYSGNHLVVRGGGWVMGDYDCAVSTRFNCSSKTISCFIGFRVCR